MTTPHGWAEIVAAYGDPLAGKPPRFVNDKGRLAVDPAWKADNLLWTQLPGILGRTYCHRALVAPAARALSRAMLEAAWYPLVLECWAPRLKRGVNQVSVHCLGVAIDLDPDQNPLIVDCPRDDARRRDPRRCTIPAAVVKIFVEEGFFWGGDFSNRFDPMHLQLCTGY